MIDSNLAVLLAERNLKITKVSRDTGISRTTLTALCYDHSGGIKFDTLNTLCKYLGITPAEFFSYSQYDYEIEFVGKTEIEEVLHNVISSPVYEYTIDIIIKRENLTWRYSVRGIVEDMHGGIPYDYATIWISPYYNEDSMYTTPADIAAVKEYEKMAKEMTVRQRNDLNNNLFDMICTAFVNDYAADNNIDPSEVPIDEDHIRFSRGI